ncbi:MAG: isochorismatase family protein [Alphaproteobacteria bacterium]|nr:isochorismatase family protein [Alphaproteobacteria bacterium]
MTKALLIIDVQKCFINKHTEHIVSKIENIQKEYDTVIISSFFNKEKSFFRENLNWNKCAKSSEEHSLAFKPKNNSTFLEHSNYSCITKDFLNFVREKDITEIHLCGMDTDACVLKTAFDCIEYDLNIQILVNFIGSSGGKEMHESGLNILYRNLGKKVFNDRNS